MPDQAVRLPSRLAPALANLQQRIETKTKMKQKQSTKKRKRKQKKRKVRMEKSIRRRRYCFICYCAILAHAFWMKYTRAGGTGCVTMTALFVLVAVVHAKELNVEKWLCTV